MSEQLMLLENPYGRRRRKMRRNPQALAMPKIAREWLGGMNLMDMGAALGGLAASTMLPAALASATTGQKLIKALASFAAAAGAGFVLRNVSPSAGKYAIAGGVAGALAQTLGLFTNIKIGQPNSGMGRRLGETTNVPSYPETTQAIMP